MNASTLQAGVFGLRVVDRRADVAALQPQVREPRTATGPTPKTLADVDVATISEAARNLRGRERAQQQRDEDFAVPADERDLDDGERQMLRELEARDREVRAHEQAHQAAAGDLAVGGVAYTYQTGPDGKRYAIGGSVDIRLQSGDTPEQTVRNMERAQRAANAPSSPSGPDRAVAAKAAQYAAAARRQQQAGDPRVDLLA
ncbi:MAG: putative metalloprotease CJM1_0395 family protein [Planctomycetota bacterium]